uniref:Uncharacterized protein n=1 Tax=Arundo donax TaxID=35708 RepID=A0A0A9E8C7_ARUDO
MLDKTILATAIKDIWATRLYSQIVSPSPMFTEQCSGHISAILYFGKSHLAIGTTSDNVPIICAGHEPCLEHIPTMA